MTKQWVAIALMATAFSAQAQVDVKSAWARPAVAGQSGTGAFMTLTAPQGAKVVGAASDVAGVTEIHEMAMQGSVMTMRAVPSLELPAGRAVELKPGGFHVMLMDLKRPIKLGETITLELRLELPDGKRVTQPLQIEVRSRAPGASGGHGAAHKH